MVVGTDNEHWADPDLGFCTCKDFYFKALSGGSECYHLKSIGKAKEASQFVQTDFDDSEYIPFLQAIMDDQATLLSRG
jgi:predicted nucleic acid-binding Zn finger protein